MLLAGGEGIEPSHALLESAVLPLYEPPTPIVIASEEIPLRQLADRDRLRNLDCFSRGCGIAMTKNYFVSLWTECLRQYLQNFFNSKRFLRVFLFLVEK